VFWIDTEPKATQQLLDDANVDIEAWLAGKVADKIGRFENAEFVAGAANKIRGFMGAATPMRRQRLRRDLGQIGYIGTGVNGRLRRGAPGDKLIDLVGLLKNAYLANAKLVHPPLGDHQDPQVQGRHGQLHVAALVRRRPARDHHGLSGGADGGRAGAGDRFDSLAFGDLAQAYQIVDRQGIRVLRDPYTSKPYVKFYTTKRAGGGVLNFEAIKLMKFS
jgi:predicted phage gp36 major capsid-like protein